MTMHSDHPEMHSDRHDFAHHEWGQMMLVAVGLLALIAVALWFVIQ
jgi:hypothetical protein